jgi:hypothetical protein
VLPTCCGYAEALEAKTQGLKDGMVLGKVSDKSDGSDVAQEESSSNHLKQSSDNANCSGSQSIWRNN